MISSHDLQILSSTSLFAGFSEDALRALCAALRPSVAELPRGRVLWRMGEQVSGGVWECGKPERFSIISMPQSEGEKGEVTFSLRPSTYSRKC